MRHNITALRARSTIDGVSIFTRNEKGEHVSLHYWIVLHEDYGDIKQQKWYKHRWMLTPVQTQDAY